MSPSLRVTSYISLQKRASGMFSFNREQWQGAVAYVCFVLTVALKVTEVQHENQNTEKKIQQL